MKYSVIVGGLAVLHLLLASGCSTEEPKRDDAVAAPDRTPHRVAVPSILGLPPAASMEQVIEAFGQSETTSTDEHGTTEVRWTGVTAGGLIWSTVRGFFGENAVVVIASSDPSGDVFEVAGPLCNGMLSTGGEAVAAWTRPPHRRYVESWRSMVRSGGAEIGCRHETPGVLALAGAAHDRTLALLVRSSESPEGLRSFLALFEAYRPMEWRTEQHFGDRMVIGNTAYVVQKLIPVERVGRGSARRTASEGARLIQVEFTLENAGMRTAMAMAGNVFVRDSLGREFLPSSDSTAAAAADLGLDLLISQLQPGVPRRQVAVFEVPTTATEFELVLPGRLGDAGQLAVPFSLAERLAAEAK